MNIPVFLICLVFLVFIPPCLSEFDGYTSCGNQFNCGSITDVDYPFWGQDRPYGCGYPGLQLNCDEHDAATIDIMKVKYRVLGINPNTQTLKIAREDYMEGICPSQFVNTTLDFTLFDYAPGYMNLTFFYGCSPVSNAIFDSFSPCVVKGFQYGGIYVLSGVHGPGNCTTSVVIPVSQEGMSELGFAFANSSGLDQLLRDGFEVKWKVDGKPCSECTKSMGKCGYNLNLNRTSCFCPNQNDGLTTCLPSPAAGAAIPGNKKSEVSLGVGLGIAGAGIVGLGLGFLFFRYRQKRKQLDAEAKSKDLPTPPSSKGISTPTTQFTRSIPSFPSSNTDFAKSNYFGVQVFDYIELEEATNNFDPSRELGDGGFGTVYYGNLLDGRVVAVKRLYENNFKRVEQFMNEVEILTRLRHKNLVVLFGCTSRKSRELLLVYEYIPNGTVADHLHGSKANSGLLTWPVRLSIAIETADALAYLHASDIIHRDVKTNNILLDNDFRVKVADFGLSRLFPTDVTHVSTAPQGTPGYVDPEYYQCYQLTDKSDVYSFGVVLMELISSKPAVDTNRHRHDINLANMAVNKIQNLTLHELIEPSLGFETDYVVKRMTTAVAELAFRCLQQEKDMRPSMEEVLEGLRAIQNEDFSVQKAEVVDIRVDEDAGLLKNIPNPPPLSPDSGGTDKWVSSSTAPNSF